MAEDERDTYTVRAIEEMLGLTRAVILGFVKAGFVTPRRGPRNAYRFGFQDVVLLRTAQSLRAADIPMRRIRQSLRRLRAQLPPSLPLTGLRIMAMGDDVIVRDGGQPLAVGSGQWLLDFDVTSAGSLLRLPTHARRESASTPDAATSPAPGDAVAGDAERAETLYDAGHPAEALASYDRAIAARPADAELRFDRAIVLEDLGRPDEAVAAYEDCLALDPAFADAHWNVARLHERLGRPRQAIRHLSAFRRLRR